MKKYLYDDLGIIPVYVYHSGCHLICVDKQGNSVMYPFYTSLPFGFGSSYVVLNSVKYYFKMKELDGFCVNFRLLDLKSS